MNGEGDRLLRHDAMHVVLGGVDPLDVDAWTSRDIGGGVIPSDDAEPLDEVRHDLVPGSKVVIERVEEQ